MDPRNGKVTESTPPEADEAAARRKQLSSRLAEQKLQVLVVTHGPNVRYLTGFTGSNGLLLLFANGSANFFTDPRYTIQAGRETTCKVKVARGPLLAAAAKRIVAKRLKRIGFEKARLSWEGYNLLTKELPLKAVLEPVGGWIEEQRTVKSKAEIEAIRQSVALNSRAFANSLNRIRPGVRESEVAAELEYQMRLLGAEKAAFETIVASGERTALPHAHPTGNRLSPSDLLLIDMGASLKGYSSDMTRMASLGRPSAKLKLMYKAVLEAQLAGVDAVREGVTAERVDRAARRILKKHGLDKAFVHSTGHGLGLEIHEAPRLGKRDKTRLKAGMAITIEPGVYVEGAGGIRIEDTVLVTEKGCEVLTQTPKELLTL